MDLEGFENNAVSTVLQRFRQTQERLAVQKSKEKFEADQDVSQLSGKRPLTKPIYKTRTPATVEAEGLSALPQPELSEKNQQLPKLQWPVKPQFISPTSTKPFSQLGVSLETCKRLRELGFENAFAVQTVIIPEMLESARRLCPDPHPAILVNSFTGSGKTLAYAVPIIDTLRARRVPRLRALILLPTKVLVHQVYTVLDQLAQGTRLRVLALKADRTISKEAQLLESAEQPPDIVVCAPGRLIEHLSLNSNLLSAVETLVIDEADRLVGQSFQNWTEVFARHLQMPARPLSNPLWKRPPQRLVFSATLTRDPAKLASLQIRATPPALPKLFVVGKKDLDGNDEFSLPSQLRERVVNVRSLTDKPLVLVNELINNIDGGRVIVFAQSNEAASRLARLISLVSALVFNQEIVAQRCSGEMRVQDRKKVMRNFTESDSGILVCTDMIARGIDMHVDYVINYDVPTGPREYVHRVGRTARAGLEGSAWTLLSPGYERKHFWALQSSISRVSAIVESTVEPEINESKYKEALKALGQEVAGI